MSGIPSWRLMASNEEHQVLKFTILSESGSDILLIFDKRTIAFV